MTLEGKFVDIEIRGGLGDLILQLHETVAWEELAALGPSDRARVTIISHNPFADELLRWHPKLAQIEVVLARHFFHEYDDPAARRAAGVQERDPGRRPPRDRQPLTFHPSQADLNLLAAELPGVPYLVLAPTASGMEIENRNLPLTVVVETCARAKVRGVPVVFLGRTYQGPHAPKATPMRPSSDGIIDLTDRLSVSGTIEVVKRCRAGLFAHSALLQIAWLDRKPNMVLYPPKYAWHDFQNPSPFGKGKDFPETVRALFSEFTSSMLSSFLDRNFPRTP